MNAIILSAGLGSRFGGMTENAHKSLLPIGGLPNIERTILFLRRAGVSDVSVVTGHMAGLFSFLDDKYGARLIYNAHYRDYNNIYSMYLALDKLQDTLVIDGDVVLLSDLFVPSEYSLYYLIERNTVGVEWIPRTGEDGFVREMLVSDDRLPSLLGISYWNAADCALIKQAFAGYLSQDTLRNPKLYWDDIPVSLYHALRVKTLLVPRNAAGEMDTPEEYESICKLAKPLPL